MFLFSADSGARPVPLNSCSDGLLHLRKRGRRGHLEMKKHFCKTEPLFIAFASTHLIGEGFYFTVHGTVLCTNSAVFRCSAKMPAFAWSRARNAALVQVCGPERRCLDLQDVPRACSDAVRRCLHLHGAMQGTLHLCKSAVQSDDARTCKTCLVYAPMQCDDASICMEPCKERCTCASLRFRATTLGLARRASCIFRCSAKMPAFAWSRARNAALVQVCGSERRCSD